jgi:Holliday junction resolvase RusA-like endonuclease
MGAAHTTDSTYTVFVPGTPVPQGSKTAFVVGRRAVVTDQNRAVLKPWRATISEYTDTGHEFSGPVFVSLVFNMPRPQKPKYNVPAVKPDIDKLTRAVLDGIKDSGLIEDDSRVTRLTVEKQYALPLGVRIEVSQP